MRICAVIKYPPIQGGVSCRGYWFARLLAARGHTVRVVTNAGEVEPAYRLWMRAADEPLLEMSFPTGGSFTVRSTTGHDARLRHTPQSLPFVTKLAALATEEIRAHGCDVVFSNYFEPYGIAAHLASGWTGVGHALKHAGSDRTRLMRHEDLGSAYKELLRHASAIVSWPDELAGLGIESGRVVEPVRSVVPREIFHPGVAPLDVDRLMREAGAAGLGAGDPGPFDPALPTLGIFGKVAASKGWFDLVRSLGRLRREGHAFNLLALAGGAQRDSFMAAVEAEGLAGKAWLLPFLPHWHVPAFLRACTAVCCLERRFPIAGHVPVRLRECFAVGAAVVASRELAAKEHRYADFDDGTNVFLVENPEDDDELGGVLRRVVADPDRARSVGRRGIALAGEDEEALWVAAYEEALQRAAEPSPRRRATPPERTGAEAFEPWIRRRLPLAAALLGPALRAALDDFCRRGGPGPAPRRAVDRVRDTYRFAEFLVEQGPGRSALPDTADLFRYGQLLAWLGLDVEGVRGTSYFPSAPPPVGCPAEVPMVDLRPVRSNYLRVARFEQDPRPRVRAVMGETTASDGGISDAGGPVILAFHQQLDMSGRIFRLSSATAELLERCDGSRSVSELSCDLGAAPSVVDAAVSRLSEEHLLVLRAASGPPR